jgi:hypothetical protein
VHFTIGNKKHLENIQGKLGLLNSSTLTAPQLLQLISTRFIQVNAASKPFLVFKEPRQNLNQILIGKSFPLEKFASLKASKPPSYAYFFHEISKSPQKPRNDIVSLIPENNNPTSKVLPSTSTQRGQISSLFRFLI